MNLRLPRLPYGTDRPIPSNAPVTPRPGNNPNAIRVGAFVRQKAAHKPIKKPVPAMQLQLQGCGDDVLACLQSIKGLQPGEGNSLVATQKLNKEDLGSIAKALELLLEADPPNVKAAGTLVLMCEPTARFALVELCPLEVMDLLVRSDPEVGHAMERAFKGAAREAIDKSQYRQFFELVAGCDVTAAPSLSKILPALTKEMVHGLDSDVFVKAMNMTLKSAQDSPLHDCLNRLHSLLAIAANLEAQNPGRALAMKCLIWRALDNLPETCARDELAKLQVMALLPELSAELLGATPGSLRGEILCVMVEQIVNRADSQQVVDGLLRLAGLYSQIARIDLELATGLESVVNEALNQLPDDQRPSSEARTLFARPGMSEVPQADLQIKGSENAVGATDLSAAARAVHDSRGASRAKNAIELFDAVRARLEKVGIDVLLHETKPPADEEAARKRHSVVREMVVILLRSGEQYDLETAARIFALVDSQPKRFIQLLLREGLGIAGYSLSVQMARALPLLCDGDHRAELEIVLESDQGKELLAQALIDHLMRFWDSDTTASLIPTLVPRLDLRAAIGSREDSAERTADLQRLLIRRFIEGEASQAEAARTLLEKLGMWSEKDALALLDAGVEGLHSSTLTLALLVLCSAKPSSGLDHLLEKGEGRWLVSHIAMNCLAHDSPGAATVALLFEGLAHRLNLGEWMTDGSRTAEAAKGIATVHLGVQAVQSFHGWSPGWRSLLLVKLDKRFCHPGWVAAAVAAEISSGIEPCLLSLGRPEMHDFLNAMMSARLPGTDTPLFSADVINYVMRAFMSWPNLAVEPTWMWALPIEQRLRWSHATQTAFNSLSDESQRFFKQSKANAALLLNPEQVQKEFALRPLAAIRRYLDVKD